MFTVDGAQSPDAVAQGDGPFEDLLSGAEDVHPIALVRCPRDKALHQIDARDAESQRPRKLAATFGKIRGRQPPANVHIQPFSAGVPVVIRIRDDFGGERLVADDVNPVVVPRNVLLELSRAPAQKRKSRRRRQR